MVKLRAELMRFLTKEEFRILTAIEMGMKNHQVVPVPMIAKIAGLRHGGVDKLIANVLRYKLVRHEGVPVDGYRLTYSGYDFLALRVFHARRTIVGIGNKMGCGKESDIYTVQTESGDVLIAKFHRLGRVSFKTVKTNRDYLQGRNSANWLAFRRHLRFSALTSTPNSPAAADVSFSGMGEKYPPSG